MHILVCGGAGYIGSHIVKASLAAGHTVVVVDNLSTGHAEAVQSLSLEQGSIGDKAFIESVLSEGQFDLVMHFCAHSLVGESMTEPNKYYENNVLNTLVLLEAMRATGHMKLVFSSTAAVFGMPMSEAIAEDHPKEPVNPYGNTKLMVEKILADYAAAYDFSSVCLRYFNAAGADPSGAIGEKHSPETHLIPNILKSVASGGELTLKVFGTDYPTPDGSCVRDYIHVNDLASAHLLAGEYLDDKPGAHVFNLGNGEGFSVLEVIAAASKVTGQEIAYDVCDRRAGDPPTLIADSRLANSVLGWKPAYTSIEDIIETAWQWHEKGELFS